MGEYNIVVSSITYAYKARDLLERKGYRVFIERASRRISSCGCYFSLRIRGGSPERAISLLRANHVRIIDTGEGY